MRKKEQKLESVAKAIASLLLSHGLQALTPARVARTAGVSRAWLYKYVGTGPALIESAVDRIGKDFAELDVPLSTETPAHLLQSIIRGTERMLERSLEQPFLMPLYFRYAQSATPIGKRIREIEELYLAKLSRAITKTLSIEPKRAHLIAELLTSLRLGEAYRRLARTDKTSPMNILLYRTEMSRVISNLIQAKTEK